MNDPGPAAGSPAAHVIAALDELIEALDRRVPQVERAGEIQLAREAARLRSVAVNRRHALESAGSDQASTQGNAVMTDDGGPPRP